ncbi:MAG: hypothetical protein KC729_15405, partial [Candidatus Eisenbacteria bacterium]|nr:hypothetical protein [Candidatus Eisenbacteria bacterium]
MHQGLPRLASVAALTVVAVLSLSQAARSAPAAEEVWKIQDGRITFHFYQDVLDRYGIRMTDIVEMANDPTHPVPPSNDPEWCVGGFRAGKVGQLDLQLLDVSEVERGLSFDITESSDLTFRVQGGIFVPYGLVSGSIRAEGGVTFQSPGSGAEWEMRDFALEYLNLPNDGPGGEPDPDLFRIRCGSGPAPFVI